MYLYTSIVVEEKTNVDLKKKKSTWYYTTKSHYLSLF